MNLKEGFDKRKKKLVDIMDKYILLFFVIYIFISNLIIQLLSRCKRFSVSGKTKFLLIFVNFSIQIVYLIFFIIKFIYVKKIGGLNIGIALEDAKLYWFYIYDLIIIFSFNGPVYKLFWLYKFKGINIIHFDPPSHFENFDKIEKK